MSTPLAIRNVGLSVWMLFRKNGQFPDIIQLYDTRCNSMDYFKPIPGHKKFIVDYRLTVTQDRTSRSRGIFVSIAKWLKPREIETDRQGDFILTLIEFEGQRIIVASCYLPNHNGPNKALWGRLHQSLINLRRRFDQVVICGDFNLILDPARNAFNYANDYNRSAKAKLEEIITEFDLVDALPNVHYTQASTRGTFGKLDYVLLRRDLVNYVSFYKSVKFTGSDHEAQHVVIEAPQIKPMPFYKVNTQLINDAVVSRRVEQNINELLMTDLGPSNLISGIISTSKVIYKEEGRKRAAKNKELKQRIDNLTEAEAEGENVGPELQEAITEYKAGSLIRMKSDLDPKLAHIQKIKAAEKATVIKKAIVGVRREDESLCKDPVECGNILVNHYREKTSCFDCTEDTKCARCVN